MSAVSRRNEVSVVESVLLPAGILFAGAVLFGAAKTLGAVAESVVKETGRQLKTDEPTKLRSVAQIKNEAKAIGTNQNFDSNAPVAVVKGKALAELAARPYVVSETAKIEPEIAALQTAATVAEVQTAQIKLTEKLEASHQQVFTSALVKACSNAALKIGFDRVETMPSSLPFTARLVATDSRGRNLVTEITTDPTREVSLATEIVGTNDNSCHDILNAFDAALEAEGVRSQPPTRKSTGGVCELAAVRDFLARKLSPQSNAAVNVCSSAESETENKSRRTQRLNQSRAGLKSR